VGVGSNPAPVLVSIAEGDVVKWKDEVREDNSWHVGIEEVE